MENGIIILEPSNGGNGIKLNTPSPILVAIVELIIIIITPPYVESKNSEPAYLYNA